jgi:hypothetical protein
MIQLGCCLTDHTISMCCLVQVKNTCMAEVICPECSERISTQLHRVNESNLLKVFARYYFGMQSKTWLEGPVPARYVINCCVKSSRESWLMLRGCRIWLPVKSSACFCTNCDIQLWNSYTNVCTYIDLNLIISYLYNLWDTSEIKPAKIYTQNTDTGGKKLFLKIRVSFILWLLL